MIDRRMVKQAIHDFKKNRSKKDANSSTDPSAKAGETVGHYTWNFPKETAKLTKLSLDAQNRRFKRRKSKAARKAKNAEGRFITAEAKYQAADLTAQCQIHTASDLHQKIISKPSGSKVNPTSPMMEKTWDDYKSSKKQANISMRKAAHKRKVMERKVKQAQRNAHKAAKAAKSTFLNKLAQSVAGKFLLVSCLFIVLFGSIIACLGSVFGIFNSNNTATLQNTVSKLNMSWNKQIQDIKGSVQYDELLVSDIEIDWQSILTVNAVMEYTAGKNPSDIDTRGIEEVFNLMNTISSNQAEAKEPEVQAECTAEETAATDKALPYISKLVIIGHHKTAAEMADILSFDADQRGIMQMFLKPEYKNHWHNLIYGSALTPTSGGWIQPIPDASVLSPFGYRANYQTGNWEMHQGADLSAPSGTGISAVKLGVVTEVLHNEETGFTVTVNHGDQVFTVYGNLATCSVTEGQSITTGQKIGSIADEAKPFLYFALQIDNTFIDPMQLYSS